MNPVYEDQIRLGFSRIQELEKQRLAHTKEIAIRYLEAINMTDTTDLNAEYERLNGSIKLRTINFLLEIN